MPVSLEPLAMTAASGRRMWKEQKHKAVRVSYPFEVAVRSVRAGTMHPGRWVLCRIIVKALPNESVLIDGTGFRFELNIWLTDRRTGKDVFLIRQLESNEVWKSRREALTRGSKYGMDAYMELVQGGLPNYAAVQAQRYLEN
jgi:hypothetical protein